MKRSHYLAIALATIAMTYFIATAILARRAQASILAQFKSVNHSVSHTPSDTAATLIPDTLQLKATAACLQTTTFIQTIKDSLKGVDGDITLPEKTLLHTPLGDSLHNALEQVTTACHSALTTTQQRHTVDSVLSAITTFCHPGGAERYLKGTPLIAVLTILTKFQSDCRKATALAIHP